MTRFSDFFVIIKLFVNNSLDLRTLNILWNELINKRLIPIESLTMCRWVQELIRDDRIDC